MGIINVSLSINPYQRSLEILVHGAGMEIRQHLKQDFPKMEFQQRLALGSARRVDDLGILAVTIADRGNTREIIDHGLGLATAVLNRLEIYGFKLISGNAMRVNPGTCTERHVWALQN